MEPGYALGGLAVADGEKEGDVGESWECHVRHAGPVAVVVEELMRGVDGEEVLPQEAGVDGVAAGELLEALLAPLVVLVGSCGTDVTLADKLGEFGGMAVVLLAMKAGYAVLVG